MKALEKVDSMWQNGPECLNPEAKSKKMMGQFSCSSDERTKTEYWQENLMKMVIWKHRRWKDIIKIYLGSGMWVELDQVMANGELP